MATNLTGTAGSDAKPTASWYTSPVQLPVPNWEVAIVFRSIAVVPGVYSGVTPQPEHMLEATPREVEPVSRIIWKSWPPTATSAVKMSPSHACRGTVMSELGVVPASPPLPPPSSPPPSVLCAPLPVPCGEAPTLPPHPEAARTASPSAVRLGRVNGAGRLVLFMGGSPCSPATRDTGARERGEGSRRAMDLRAGRIGIVT